MINIHLPISNLFSWYWLRGIHPARPTDIPNATIQSEETQIKKSSHDIHVPHARAQASRRQSEETHVPYMVLAEWSSSLQNPNVIWTCNFLNFTDTIHKIHLWLTFFVTVFVNTSRHSSPGSDRRQGSTCSYLPRSSTLRPLHRWVNLPKNYE